MKKINIHDYVTFKGKNTWLLYMVDKIDFFTSKEPEAFCFAKKGKFSIHIGQSILDTKDNELLIQLIQHELGHGTLGHLNYMNTLKDDSERQLFNILADCSIHMHNPWINDEERSYYKDKFNDLILQRTNKDYNEQSNKEGS